jgi:hypothetical protein
MIRLVVATILPLWIVGSKTSDGNMAAIFGCGKAVEF